MVFICARLRLALGVGKGVPPFEILIYDTPTIFLILSNSRYYNFRRIDVNLIMKLFDDTKIFIFLFFGTFAKSKVMYRKFCLKKNKYKIDEEIFTVSSIVRVWCVYS